MNYGNNQDQAVMGANGRQMGLVIPEGEPWALVGRKAEGACSGFLVPPPKKNAPSAVIPESPHIKSLSIWTLWRLSSLNPALKNISLFTNMPVSLSSSPTLPATPTPRVN